HGACALIMRNQHHTHDERERDRQGNDGCQPVPANEFADAVGERVAVREHGPTLEVPADVGSEEVDGGIPTYRVLLQRQHRDAVEISADSHRARVAAAGAPRRYLAWGQWRLLADLA